MSTNPQRGFSLIELIIVIVILGALSAVALPRFVDLSQEADRAALEGVAGTLSSAAAINFSADIAGSGDALDVTNCEDVQSLLSGGLPAGYSIDPAPVAEGATTDCTLNSPEGQTATFQAIGVIT